MKAKDRKDFSSYELIVKFTSSLMRLFDPDDLDDQELGSIIGMIRLVGFLETELPENLNDGFIIDLDEIYRVGFNTIRNEETDYFFNGIINHNFKD